MIKAECRTNLDEYKLVTWPTVFARCPNVGEWVCARDGKTLRVSGITHAEIGGEPFILVNLDKMRL